MDCLNESSFFLITSGFWPIRIALISGSNIARGRWTNLGIRLIYGMCQAKCLCPIAVMLWLVWALSLWLQCYYSFIMAEEPVTVVVIPHWCEQGQVLVEGIKLPELFWDQLLIQLGYRKEKKKKEEKKKSWWALFLWDQWMQNVLY